jgi:hypothetical protein
MNLDQRIVTFLGIILREKALCHLLHPIIIIAEIFLGKNNYQLICLRTKRCRLLFKKQFFSKGSPPVLDSWLKCGATFSLHCAN